MTTPPSSRRPRILVLTSTLPRHADDPEPRFVLDLCRRLQRDHEILLLAPADPQAALEEELFGVRVRRYRYAPHRYMERLAYPGSIMSRLRSNPLLWLLVPLLLAGLFRETRRCLRTGQFELVHCHWMIPQGLVALCLHRLYGIPYVLTCHGSDVHSLNHRAILPVKKWILMEAAAVTVVSEEMRSVLRSKIGVPEAAAKATILSMGTDLAQFSPNHRANDWPEQHGLGRPLVLFVGRLSLEKGLRHLLDAIADRQLSEIRPYLAIVGQGPLYEDLRAQAARLGVADRVKFLGGIPHSDLCVAYASADVLCVPSSGSLGGEREGLPTVLLEAAASGLPAVATKLGGIPEAVIDGSTGLLVEPGDSGDIARGLGELLGDPVRRARMSRSCRVHASLFGWDRVSERMTQIIKRALCE